MTINIDQAIRNFVDLPLSSVNVDQNWLKMRQIGIRKRKNQLDICVKATSRVYSTFCQMKRKSKIACKKIVIGDTICYIISNAPSTKETLENSYNLRNDIEPYLNGNKIYRGQIEAKLIDENILFVKTDMHT